MYICPPKLIQTSIKSYLNSFNNLLQFNLWHTFYAILLVCFSSLFSEAPVNRPRAKPTSKVEDFVPEGDVDGFFEDDEDDEDEDDEEEEDRCVNY